MGWGGRWEGGSGWGTHVNPWLIHVSVWQKPLQYCKVISLQLIKISGKKKKKKNSFKINKSISASLVAQTVKRLPTMRETWVRSLGREDPLEKEMAPHSCLENPMDGGARKAIVAKSQTQLSDFTSLQNRNVHVES